MDSSLNDTRQLLRSFVSIDEGSQARALAKQISLNKDARQAIENHAVQMIRTVRSKRHRGNLEKFLAEYGLSTQEGVALMCLAEAMLRVPDNYTIDELIKDKIEPYNWDDHLGESNSFLVNLSTWGLMLTGRAFVVQPGSLKGTITQIIKRLGEPLVREVIAGAMKILGGDFILGRQIPEALKRGRAMIEKGYTYSFDMLGEAARNERDAQKYFDSYSLAISEIGKTNKYQDIHKNSGISVKLSALHSRYERSQVDVMLPAMVERVLSLARAASEAQIGFNIDAEEARRLDLSLDVVEHVLSDPSISGWDGFGVVVQAYDKRAPVLLDWLYRLSIILKRKIMVRLVKGAYWDQEIKYAQVCGLENYPVFSRKSHTDLSYLACAQKLLGMNDRIYPQFATHNVHTVAAILHMARDTHSFEFQRLHGMGEILHEFTMAQSEVPCRIYAPIGEHKDLLAYLVRRLLENGASNSFVNQLLDESYSHEDLARDPITVSMSRGFSSNPNIPMPSSIFPERCNSKGWDLDNPRDLFFLENARSSFKQPYSWVPTEITSTLVKKNIINPAYPNQLVGTVQEASQDSAKDYVSLGLSAFSFWKETRLDERAEYLDKISTLYEENIGELLSILSREAGKNLVDGVSEIREAVDFLRYYSSQAKKLDADRQPLGVVLCISPWNFPLAIFTGQIAAALVTGNTVIAKPAEQTPLIASFAIRLFREAGLPDDVVQLALGHGSTIGAELVADNRINGVCFTGSLDVAKKISCKLAEHTSESVLIAETGGLNAMIVDSTALMEQAVGDIIRSAFQSAGQRCSALRILYIQEEIEEDCLKMLFGAMDMMRIGDPWLVSTDIGPLIDEEAKSEVLNYLDQARKKNQILKEVSVPSSGFFVSPSVLRVNGIESLKHEVFGPILHVTVFSGKNLTDVINSINDSGYGLTLGLHTRIDMRAKFVIESAKIGNVYINRDQIGATVGSQPFGGEGLSGTGPKAGGPLYLERFTRIYKEKKFVKDEYGVEGKTIDKVMFENAIEAINVGNWDQLESQRISILKKSMPDVHWAKIEKEDIFRHYPTRLGGVTGELNQYRLVPKGLVCCLGPDTDSLILQFVQALAMGNRVVVIGKRELSTVVDSLRAEKVPITGLYGKLDYDVLATVKINAVSYAGNDNDTLSKIKKVIAKRPGPIIQVVVDSISSPVSYCHERSACLDLTSTGGDVSLLTALDS